MTQHPCLFILSSVMWNCIAKRERESTVVFVFHYGRRAEPAGKGAHACLSWCTVRKSLCGLDLQMHVIVILSITQYLFIGLHQAQLSFDTAKKMQNWTNAWIVWTAGSFCSPVAASVVRHRWHFSSRPNWPPVPLVTDQAALDLLT